MLESRSVFYRNRNSNASDFRSAYISFHENYGKEKIEKWQKNYSRFKDVAKRIYKKNRFEKAIKNIESKEEGYTSVSYDSVFNSDQLHKMKFSHDTLLEYSELLFKNYSMLRRLVIDKYPYIFIDEYQDANPLVINIINYLYEYSRDNNKRWLIGYFGDSAQTIYEDGIGRGIETIHKKINNIYKPYNRRSQKQIIDIANLIRNDSIKQTPILKNKTNGIVNFYHYPNFLDENQKISIANNFIFNFQESLTTNPKIDCLVLTNEIMSKMIGFGEIYNSFKSADNIYFDDLKTKLLSNELEKLDPTIRIIFKLLNNYLSIHNEKSTFYDILGEKGRNITFKEAHTFLETLKKIDPKNLNDLINKISELYSNDKRTKCTEIFIERFLGSKVDDINDYDDIKTFLRSELRELMVIKNDNNDHLSDLEIKKVNDVLNISIEVWEKWVNFIKKEQSGNIHYHTYHGTKGEEYENVAIIMQHSFGSSPLGRDKFKDFFKFKGKEEHINLEDSKLINTQNLIYVACTRAEKNLWILYLDDIKDIEEGIKSIFGVIKEWTLYEAE